MFSRRPKDMQLSDITPREVYFERRHFVRAAVEAGLLSAAAIAAPPLLAATSESNLAVKQARAGNSPFSTDEALTPQKDVTTYNNFYEFGTDKRDPAKHAGQLRTRPWSVTVEGECNKPGVYDLEDIMGPHALEERIYRLRCVEAWSMVIPWEGFPLADLLKRFEPSSRAKYVEFTTLYDPEQMPGQRRAVLNWPYVEGLRIDEAMHPLTIIAVGLYGEVLPNQNGAPLRLVVPWKYGFKSIKSIARIRFTESPPTTSWFAAAPREYGFYSNVNPSVDHPRWSQKKERRLDGSLLSRKIETRMFNGYADQVGHLYAGMDLKKNF